MTDYQIFELGNVVLQSQETLRDAKLAYKTFGTLNAKKDNVVVYRRRFFVAGPTDARF